MLPFISTAGAALLRHPEMLAGPHKAAAPFPHSVIDGFFDPDWLNQVVDEFPDMNASRASVSITRPHTRKSWVNDPDRFGPRTRELVDYLNSRPFMDFVAEVSGIEEELVADPYFLGGGLHEIRRGGYLKIHADFNRHPQLKLDRRINILVYLNRDWDESYGGDFELWREDMSGPERKIAPLFNRIVIFNTTDHSFHGHPDKLRCPPEQSRKSLALFYYSDGRPVGEAEGDHGTLFRSRPGRDVRTMALNAAKAVAPSSLVQLAKRAIG